MKNKVLAAASAAIMLTSQVTVFALDNTNGVMTADDGNNVDFSEVMQSGSEQSQTNRPAAQPDTGVTADFEGFHQQMDAFLESAGFNYSDFTSQKFSLPDMSTISSEADMKEQYAEMVSGLSKYGFGQQAVLPDNSGYTLNAIGSFKEAFGDGLKSGFTPYTEFTFDNQAVFADFNANRDALFSSAKMSTGYNEISQMMNISGAWSSFSDCKNKIDPDSIDPGLLGFNTLKNTVDSYAISGIDELKNGFTGSETLTVSNFETRKQEVEDMKTEMKKTADDEFQIVYTEKEFIPPSYDNGYMGKNVTLQKTYDIRTDGIHDSKVDEKLKNDLGLDNSVSDIDSLAQALKDNKGSENYKEMESDVNKEDHIKETVKNAADKIIKGEYMIDPVSGTAFPVD